MAPTGINAALESNGFVPISTLGGTSPTAYRLGIFQTSRLDDCLTPLQLWRSPSKMRLFAPIPSGMRGPKSFENYGNARARSIPQSRGPLHSRSRVTERHCHEREACFSRLIGRLDKEQSLLHICSNAFQQAKSERRLRTKYSDRLRHSRSQLNVFDGFSTARIGQKPIE